MSDKYKVGDRVRFWAAERTREDWLDEFDLAESLDWRGTVLSTPEPGNPTPWYGIQWDWHAYGDWCGYWEEGRYYGWQHFETELEPIDE
jgi:hypothetical protein